jgi:hypothetical protein
MPLRSPATGRGSTKYKYAGAIDLIQGERVIDWKSTSDIDNFLARKGVGFQPECYALALRRMGYKITEYEYRVIQTPGIKLCSKDAKEAEATGRTPGQCYEERCLEWLQSQPGRVRPYPHPITDSALQQAAEWLWGVRERIALGRKTGRFLTNESACNSFNTPCPFQSLCQACKDGDNVQDVINIEYQQKANTHPELGISGADVITYSSASKFSLCEQRWYWSNEMGLERKGEGTSDALYVGSAMHKGLEHLGGACGLADALLLIDRWAYDNPTVGEEACAKQAQSIGKARAMVRAASAFWGMGTMGEAAT